MLEVRAIKKYHDKNGILLGYLIQREGTDETMQVTKDALKQAVVNGQCRVVNLTLTSDKRFIGKAAPLPKKRNVMRKVSEVECLVQVLTSSGKPIMGVTAFILPKKLEELKASTDVKKLCQAIQANKTRQNFVLRDELGNKLKNHVYANVNLGDNSKISLSQLGISSKKFDTQAKQIRELLNNKGGLSGYEIEKVDKTTYNIKLNVSNKDASLLAIAIALNALGENKIKTESYSIDNAVLVAKCFTGVNDLRKALKTLQ